ncbi:hypothetical protein FRX31_003974 [Thalictrum thalictroides]|uniref:Uncharacterized protein n=1 Tax=Thalictrum thalictroides TaxID=46969 RepID=A0A7J6X9Z8_THATH|nr:hypothetical protein FRX31_003974 [Thalictrum thalictroides]
MEVEDNQSNMEIENQRELRRDRQRHWRRNITEEQRDRRRERDRQYYRQRVTITTNNELACQTERLAMSWHQNLLTDANQINREAPYRRLTHVRRQARRLTITTNNELAFQTERLDMSWHQNLLTDANQINREAPYRRLTHVRRQARRMHQMHLTQSSRMVQQEVAGIPEEEIQNEFASHEINSNEDDSQSSSTDSDGLPFQDEDDDHDFDNDYINDVNDMAPYDEIGQNQDNATIDTNMEINFGPMEITPTHTTTIIRSEGCYYNLTITRIHVLFLF